MQTFGHTSGMYHIVELVVAELLLQLFFRREVQLDQVDALVLQEGARTRLAHGSPRIKTSLERFFYDEGANETAGSSH